MLLTWVTSSLTVMSILLRGLVIDPHVAELLRGLVIDPHVAELLRGLVFDPCIAEYLRDPAHDHHVDDPFHALLVEYHQCIVGALKTPPVFVSLFSKPWCGIS